MHIRVDEPLITNYTALLEFNPGGYLQHWYTGVCVWRVKSRPKNMGPSKLYSRNLVQDVNLLPKNVGAKFPFKTRIPSTFAQNVLDDLRNDFKPNWCALARNLEQQSPQNEKE